MAIDYGFWSALTAPIQTAGQRQQQRDADSLKALQLMQNMKTMQRQDLSDQKELQKQTDLITQAAQNDLKTSFGLKREKDINDQKAWHRDFSGWTDIENVLKEYGNVHNARAYGDLDGLIQEYKYKVRTAHEDPTKGNPILQRMNQNKSALENYHKYAIDKDNAHLLSYNSKLNYRDYANGEIDNFRFGGPIKDYLTEDYINSYGVDENVTMDRIIGDNYISIIGDITNDLDLSPEETASLTDKDIKGWVKNNLGVHEQGGVTFAGDTALYGGKDIKTEWATELVRGLDGVAANNLLTVNDILDVEDEGVPFSEVFDKVSGNQWDNLGGTDKNSKVQDYDKWYYLGKGRQVVASGRLFTDNQELETILTNSWAGKYDDGNNKYRSDKNKVYDVNMAGLYNSYGHEITGDDMGWTWPREIPTGFITGEYETMDLELTGYHIVPKITGTDSNGDRVNFLLTKTENKKDIEKIRKQYGNAQVNYVMAAELIDSDWLTFNDAYYKEVNMGDPTIQAAINQAMPSDNLNKVKNQMATYEQKQTQRAHSNKNTKALKNKLAVNIAAGNTEKLDVIANVYDETLTVGMKMAGVPTKTIQSTMPLVMADLYNDSQQSRQYPIKLTDGEQEFMVNTPSQYMAISTRILKSGLGNDPRYGELLEAMKGGPSAYQQWHEKNHDKKTHNSVMKDSRDWAKYFNLAK